MHPKYHYLRLVRPQDTRYRENEALHSTRRFRYKDYQGPTEDQRFTQEFEEAARSWLGVYREICDSRVLAYDIFDHNSRMFFAAYREIDAVEGAPDNPRRIFEVKTSINRNAATKARKQVRKALGVMRTRWPEVQGCIVLADLASTRTPPAKWLTSPQDLGDGLQTIYLDSEAVQTIYLSHHPKPNPELLAHALEVAYDRVSQRSANSLSASTP